MSISVALPDEAVLRINNTAHFTDKNWQEWDAQIERDVAAGKLDWLAERALSAVTRAI